MISLVLDGFGVCFIIMLGRDLWVFFSKVDRESEEVLMEVQGNHSRNIEGQVGTFKLPM